LISPSETGEDNDEEEDEDDLEEEEVEGIEENGRKDEIGIKKERKRKQGSREEKVKSTNYTRPRRNSSQIKRERDPAMEVDEMDEDEVDADLQAARERERDKDKPKEPVRKYTKEEKAARIARWKEKKPRRKFSNLIRYECRKKFADHRRREGGRFVAKTPEERLAHEKKKKEKRKRKKLD